MRQDRPFQLLMPVQLPPSITISKVMFLKFELFSGQNQEGKWNKAMGKAKRPMHIRQKPSIDNSLLEMAE